MIYSTDGSKPDPSIFRTIVSKSSMANIWESLQNAISVNASRPFIAGKRVSASLNFGSVNPWLSLDLTIPCPGAQVGDQVILGSPAPNTGTCYTAHVAAVDLVTVRFNNYSAAPVNPSAGTFICTVIPTV